MKAISWSVRITAKDIIALRRREHSLDCLGTWPGCMYIIDMSVPIYPSLVQTLKCRALDYMPSIVSLSPTSKHCS